MKKNIYMKKIGQKAKNASLYLPNTNIIKRNEVLKEFGKYLKQSSKVILNANKKDVYQAKLKKIKKSMIERLELNNRKIEQMHNSIKKNNKF